MEFRIIFFGWFRNQGGEIMARHYDESHERFFKSPRASELGSVAVQCSSCNNLVFAEFMEDSKGLIALVCRKCNSVTSYEN